MVRMRVKKRMLSEKAKWFVGRDVSAMQGFENHIPLF